MSTTLPRMVMVLLVASTCFHDAGAGEASGGLSSTAGPSTSSSGTGADGTSTGPSVTTGSDTTGDTPTTGGDPNAFIFAPDPPEAYMQIDRHGAVEAGTAAIAAAQGLGFTMGADIAIRDAYNASDPAQDAAGAWLDAITESMTFFHGALDDDVVSLKLIPATLDDTLAQVGPVVVPDTIKYDPAQPTAYPNGRKLEDQVVDITLAAVLLKLGADQPLSVFADLPLNPPANDVPFLAEFPYLAPPHP